MSQSHAPLNFFKTSTTKAEDEKNVNTTKFSFVKPTVASKSIVRLLENALSTIDESDVDNNTLLTEEIVTPTSPPTVKKEVNSTEKSKKTNLDKIAVEGVISSTKPPTEEEEFAKLIHYSIKPR